MRTSTPSSALQLFAAPRRILRCTLPNLFALRRSRRALAALTEEQLRDAGISHAEAEKEAARPVWDAPASWKS